MLNDTLTTLPPPPKNYRKKIGNKIATSNDKVSTY